tara:strand:+ start:232 stop:840 length:609 start_codon:yes stop_codon:yes gene_type:complete
MAGINTTFSNILELIGSLYPLFIVSFLVIASIFNWNILKGVTYLGGIVLCFVSWMLIGKLFNKQRSTAASLTCNLLSVPGNFIMPNLPIMISLFTYAYIIIPMIEASLINPVVIAVMTILSGVNAFYQYDNSCTDMFGIIFSIIIGLILGSLWFVLFWASGKNELLFYNELISNNVMCNRPSNQTFKCTVYKNGEIISRNVV